MKVVGLLLVGMMETDIKKSVSKVLQSMFTGLCFNGFTVKHYIRTTMLTIFAAIDHAVTHYIFKQWNTRPIAD